MFSACGIEKERLRCCAFWPLIPRAVTQVIRTLYYILYTHFLTLSSSSTLAIDFFSFGNYLAPRAGYPVGLPFPACLATLDGAQAPLTQFNSGQQVDRSKSK
jgi:hypothetical protein